MNQPVPSTQPEAFGRYLLYPAIARGGMATVHTARLVGAEGFTRLVAAKRLHPQFTDDPDFVTMFHDEACIASRIHHPNVVPVLDVVVSGHELILVQEYVHGVPLSQLMKVAQLSNEPIAIDVVVAVLVGVLSGLHAAHEVRDESDTPLEIVHRDVSPANVMISVDGVPRLLDFGIAKARTSTHHTREGVFKGKLAYMAPEQLRMDGINRTVDLYATGVLAWELLVNRRVYDNRHELAFVTAVMHGEIPSLTAALEESRDSMDEQRWRDIVALEPVVTRAMSPNPEERYTTAEEMLRAILEVRSSATSMVVTEWVRTVGADFLDRRQKTLAANEESWRRTNLYTPTPMSGTQRTADRASAPSGPPSPPSSTSPSASPTAYCSVPPSVSSLAPSNTSGAYRFALDTAPLAPLAKLGADLRKSRLLPWIAAASLVLAGLVGGLLRSGGDTAPRVDTSLAAPQSAPPEAITHAPVLTLAPGPAAAAVAPAVAVPAAPATTVAPSAAPAQAAPQVAWRPAHVAPAPPPRWVPPPRPAPPPAASSAGQPTAASTASSSKADCNPPFFFEGSKKIFKSSCL